MAAVERVCTAVRLEGRLLAIELVADLEVVFDARVSEPVVTLALADILLLAAVDIDATEEGELALLVYHYAVVEVFQFGLSGTALQGRHLRFEPGRNLRQWDRQLAGADEVRLVAGTRAQCGLVDVHRLHHHTGRDAHARSRGCDGSHRSGCCGRARDNENLPLDHRHRDTNGHHQRGGVAGLFKPRVAAVEYRFERSRGHFARSYRRGRRELIQHRADHRIRPNRHLEVCDDRADARALVGDPVDQRLVHRGIPDLAILG